MTIGYEIVCDQCGKPLEVKFDGYVGHSLCRYAAQRCSCDLLTGWTTAVPEKEAYYYFRSNKKNDKFVIAEAWCHIDVGDWFVSWIGRDEIVSWETIVKEGWERSIIMVPLPPAKKVEVKDEEARDS